VYNPGPNQAVVERVGNAGGVESARTAGSGPARPRRRVGDHRQRLDDRLMAGTLQSSTRSGLVTARRWQSRTSGRDWNEGGAQGFVVTARSARSLRSLAPASSGYAARREAWPSISRDFGVAQRALAAAEGGRGPPRRSDKTAGSGALLRARGGTGGQCNRVSGSRRYCPIWFSI